MNKIVSAFIQKSYFLFYYRLFSNAIAIRRKDTIIGTIYAKINKWPETVKLIDGKYDLCLPRSYAKILINEKSLWEKWYGNDFRNKIVLDIGAGAGETASFFFNRGAKMVVAIENNETALKYLEENRLRNNWFLAIIRTPFNLSHLNLPHDYLKMDIEGAEIALLDYPGDIGKCSLELHPEIIGKENVKTIIERFDLKPIMRPRVYGK
jgi:hypothetical protein